MTKVFIGVSSLVVEQVTFKLFGALFGALYNFPKVNLQSPRMRDNEGFFDVLHLDCVWVSNPERDLVSSGLY